MHGITAHLPDLVAVNLMQQDWIPDIWLLGLTQSHSQDCPRTRTE